MIRRFVLSIAGIVYTLLLFADNVLIKYQGYVKEPIRDNVSLLPDSLLFPADADTIIIPDFGI